MPPHIINSSAFRLALLYTAFFSVIGTMMPFWPVFLAHRGMDPVEIGALLGSLYWAKVITNPTIGAIVDANGRRKSMMILLSACSAALFAAYIWADGFWLFLILGVAGGSLFAGVLPLSDTLTMSLTLKGRLDYGRVRLWGSISFIAMASATGWLVEAVSPEAVLWAVVAGGVFTCVTTMMVPDVPMSEGQSARLPFRTLIGNGRYLLFIASASLIQAGHSVYYGFATLHWRDAGLSASLVGGLWSLGVVAEVLLFMFSGRIVAALGAPRLLALGAAAGVARWSILSATTDPVWLAPAQLLHALTFGASHLGAMHLIAGDVPPRLIARAQATYSAVAQGLVPGIALLSAGPLYAALGADAFLTSAGVAAGATGLALLLMRVRSRPAPAAV